MKLNSAGKPTKKYLLVENGELFLVAEPEQKNQMASSRLSSFVQKDLPTSNIERYSKPMDLSNLRVFTFLVINNGLNPIICQVEVSPDGLTWGACGESELTIAPGEMQVVVPQYFLRFARVKFKNKIRGFNSMVTVWFQGQR